jgi:SAM-dependent methyltransferase
VKEFYKEDLAFIHDVGHSDFALKSAPGILDILRGNEIHEGLVVDLGCGSGLWAERLVKAHYQVLGIDISEAMISIARKRVPEAEFRIESLFKADIPPCRAVTSISECFNYLFDSDNDNHTLGQLFRRIYNALAPGGVFVFDIGEPGQVKQGVTAKGFTEGDDWTVLVEKKEERKILTRRIVSFRKVGKHYRRDTELHRQRLYESSDIAKQLRRTGFRVRTIRSYGRYPLPESHAAFIARKPA